MIILVGGEKGGSGKSCLAQNIAVYLRTEEEGNVLMVDCDPQRTTSDWVQERCSNPQLPHINCIQLYGKIRNELLSLRERYDYLVIDCGGQDNLALRSSMAVADHVLVPLRPKRRDLKTVEHMEDIVSTCQMVNPNMNMAFVITQCPSLPSLAPRILEAKEVCRSYGLPVLDAVTYSRNMYDDSEESGMSVMESEPDGKCATEIRQIIHELLYRGQRGNHEPAELEAKIALVQ
ncbi:AAA family ATPase [Ferrimonas balearica]|uniref:AAA family ATPase n=1 Tax=Ferrimonas balearica TaxID=44012 RepID=UPI001C998C2E|nr:AAA family ATPase [Ferrimonas balearica]MBY5922253.1 AAA family ATPase [Ferrimonas balearica]MBY5994407.1 AAA family ATPase [Ferrimonas balearica]